jgi:hypothetical protein
MFVKPEAIPAAAPTPFNAGTGIGISSSTGGGGGGGMGSKSSRGGQSFRKKSRVESGLVSSLEMHSLQRRRRALDKSQLLYDFQDIVDEDETQAYEDYISEVLCGRLIESTPFRLIVLLAIVLNTALVGIATNTGMFMSVCRRVVAL